MGDSSTTNKTGAKGPNAEGDVPELEPQLQFNEERARHHVLTEEHSTTMGTKPEGSGRGRGLVPGGGGVGGVVLNEKRYGGWARRR